MVDSCNQFTNSINKCTVFFLRQSHCNTVYSYMLHSTRDHQYKYHTILHKTGGGNIVLCKKKKVVKFTLEQATKAQRGEQRHSSTLSLTSALPAGGCSTPRPAILPPRKRSGTHCTGGWVGPRAGLNRCGKSAPPPGFDTRTVQPAASRYTD